MKPEIQRALLAAAGRYIRKMLDPVELRLKALEGRVVEKGDKGDQGEPGRDAPTLQEIVDAMDTQLEIHLLKADLAFERRELEFERRMADALEKRVAEIPKPKDGKDGEPGRDGKDGADFSDFHADFDGERTITIRSGGAVITKRLPIPLDRGYWGEGFKAEKGDIVTHNGVAWIATDDTANEPVAGADGWRVFARKGRDGKDGHVVRVPESVKIRG